MINDLTRVLSGDLLNDLIRFTNFNDALFNDIMEALLNETTKTVLQQNMP